MKKTNFTKVFGLTLIFSLLILVVITLCMNRQSPYQLEEEISNYIFVGVISDKEFNNFIPTLADLNLSFNREEVVECPGNPNSQDLCRNLYIKGTQVHKDAFWENYCKKSYSDQKFCQ
jgi:hypothetical protein